MKKVLLAIALLMACGTAQAGIISYDQFTSATTITNMNTAMNTMFNDHNGNITTLNIADGTITSADIAASSNPVVRDYELIGNMVYSGLLPVTSTDLTSNISAGTCYVNGYRITKDATSKTYTASKDTWVYIDQNGAFSYSVVNNDAAQPTTPDNSVLLAKVVTDTDNITSVVDYRNLTPANLRIYQNYIMGCVISRDISDSDKISIDVGEIELGTNDGKIRINTAPVYVNFSTTGRGALDTGTLATGYYYIHAISDDANSTNWEAIGSLSKVSPTGYSGTRLVGWCYASSASTISPDSVGAYKGKGSGQPNIAYKRIDDTSRAYSANVLDTLATLRFYTSGRPVSIRYGVNGLAAADGNKELCLSIDSAAVPGSWVGFRGATGTPFLEGRDAEYFVVLYPGEHTIDFKYRSTASDVIRNYHLIAEEK